MQCKGWICSDAGTSKMALTNQAINRLSEDQVSRKGGGKQTMAGGTGERRGTTKRAMHGGQNRE